MQSVRIMKIIFHSLRTCKDSWKRLQGWTRRRQFCRVAWWHQGCWGHPSSFLTWRRASGSVSGFPPSSLSVVGSPSQNKWIQFLIPKIYSNHEKFLFKAPVISFPISYFNVDRCTLTIAKSLFKNLFTYSRILPTFWFIIKKLCTSTQTHVHCITLPYPHGRGHQSNICIVVVAALFQNTNYVFLMKFDVKMKWNVGSSV